MKQPLNVGLHERFRPIFAAHRRRCLKYQRRLFNLCWI